MLSLSSLIKIPQNKYRTERREITPVTTSQNSQVVCAYLKYLVHSHRKSLDILHLLQRFSNWLWKLIPHLRKSWIIQFLHLLSMLCFSIIQLYWALSFQPSQWDHCFQARSSGILSSHVCFQDGGREGGTKVCCRFTGLQSTFSLHKTATDPSTRIILCLLLLLPLEMVWLLLGRRV